MSAYTINVPMCCRDDLLMPPPVGHRGWWAIVQRDPPTLGEAIDFVCVGATLARGVVTKVVPAGADHVSGAEWRNWVKIEWGFLNSLEQTQ